MAQLPRHLCRLLSQRIAKGEILEHVALVFVGAGDGLCWGDYETAWGLLDVANQDVSDDGDPHEALVGGAVCRAGRFPRASPPLFSLLPLLASPGRFGRPLFIFHQKKTTRRPAAGGRGGGPGGSPSWVPAIGIACSLGGLVGLNG